jgi:hypothetical protein
VTSSSAESSRIGDGSIAWQAFFSALFDLEDELDAIRASPDRNHGTVATCNAEETDAVLVASDEVQR